MYSDFNFLYYSFLQHNKIYFGGTCPLRKSILNCPHRTIKFISNQQLEVLYDTIDRDIDTIEIGGKDLSPCEPMIHPNCAHMLEDIRHFYTKSKIVFHSTLNFVNPQCYQILSKLENIEIIANVFTLQRDIRKKLLLNTKYIYNRIELLAHNIKKIELLFINREQVLKDIDTLRNMNIDLANIFIKISPINRLLFKEYYRTKYINCIIDIKKNIPLLLYDVIDLNLQPKTKPAMLYKDIHENTYFYATELENRVKALKDYIASHSNRSIAIVVSDIEYQYILNRVKQTETAVIHLKIPSWYFLSRDLIYNEILQHNKYDFYAFPYEAFDDTLRSRYDAYKVIKGYVINIIIF